MPLIHAISVLFRPVTLERPMTLFTCALGLVPGVPSVPSSDFVMAIVDHEHQTLRAYVRSWFGEKCKNLQDRARGLKTSPGG